jgi:hypothetical protein
MAKFGLPSLKTAPGAVRSSFEVLKDVYDIERALNSIGYTLIPSAETWTAPTLLNNWVNYGGGFNNAGYYKDPFGVVHLRGLIKDGTTTLGTALFTLPTGYRPVAQELFTVTSGSALGRVDVLTTGNVVINVGSSSWLSLDGLTFRAV